MAKQSKKSTVPTFTEQAQALGVILTEADHAALTQLTAELPPIEEQTLQVIEGSETLELTAEDIAALEQSNTVQAPEAPAETVQSDEAPVVSFGEAMAEYDDEARKEAAAKVGGQFDDRIRFEQSQPDHKPSIVATLNKSRAKLAMPSAAAVLLAAQVPVSFMNRSISAGSAYNVYAVEKVADIVKALGGGELGNAINIAVCRSLFRFRAAGETFTGEMAKACASDKIRIQGQIAKVLVRHTVSASTAPTQASSTMQALTTLGIVKNKGTQKAPVYELTDTPQTKRLEEVVTKLAA